MATLWRLRGSEIDPAKLAHALDGFENMYRPSAVRDQTGDLLVSFFSSASDGKSALESAKSALRLATAPDPIVVKLEWGGPVVPEPDRARPETFPPIPTAASLTRRSRSELFLADVVGNWFDVEALIENIATSAEFDRIVSDLRLTVGSMRRFDRPKVTPRQNDRSVVVRFGISASNVDDAKRRAAAGVEAALSASSPTDMEAQVRIVVVNERQPRG